MDSNTGDESNSANEVLGTLALPRSTAVFACLPGCVDRDAAAVLISRRGHEPSISLLGGYSTVNPLQSQLRAHRRRRDKPSKAPESSNG